MRMAMALLLVTATHHSTHLCLELLVVGEEGVVLGAGGVQLAAQRVVVLLQLLGLPPGAAVLEPDGHLAGLQPQRAGQLRLALRLQLVGHLEAALQRAHLLHAQPPLPLAARRRGGPLLVVRRAAAAVLLVLGFRVQVAAAVVAHAVGVHALNAACQHLRRRRGHGAAEVVEEGADERRGRGSQEVVVAFMVLVLVVRLLLLLHLEEEVSGEEGGGHAIGCHWLHRRSERNMGREYIDLPSHTTD
jgi:hypothetical protein